MAEATKTRSFDIPQFGQAPVSEMPKPAQSNYISKAEQASQDAFDGFVKSLKPGVAGVATVPASSSYRTVMGRIRGAFKRTGLEMGTLRADHDGGKVYVTLKAAQNGSAPAPHA